MPRVPTITTRAARIPAVARWRPGAQKRPADRATETITTRPMAEVVELVEVGILAEGRAHAAREDRSLGAGDGT